MHTAVDIYETDYKLYELEQLLPGYFMRISKSAIAIVAGGLGYLPTGLPVIKIILSILLLTIFLKSIASLDFFGITMPVAFAACLYDRELGITSITPWTVIIAAVLVAIGLDIMFSRTRQKLRYKKNYKDRDHSSSNEQFIDAGSENSDDIYIHASLTAIIKYVNSDNLKRITIDNSFAGIKLYLDGAKIPSGEAVIDLRNQFAGLELYIPKSWHVISELSCSLGGIEEKNVEESTGSPVLRLKGSCSFGGVTIIHV